MGFSRRRFLSRGSAAMASLALPGCGAEERPRTLGELPWGSTVSSSEAQALPPLSARPDGVFELYLFGGLCAWDTFYVVPEFGDPAAGGPLAGTLWWTYQSGLDNVEQHFRACGGVNRDLLQPFGLDSAGRSVNLGPWTLPLRDRPDILNRMRVLVMRHDQVPHQGGNPISLGGHRLGNPRLAGTAAHVQRFQTERAPAGRAAPYATALLPRGRDVATNNADAAAATGLHDRSARPLVLWLNDRPDFADQLQRPAFRDHLAEADALIDAYTAGFDRRLADPRGGLVRAPVLDDYKAARDGSRGAEELSNILPFDAIRAGRAEICESSTTVDLTSAGLATGARLLLHPQQPARYVISVDGGFLPATGGASYDTHSLHVAESARNVTHAMRQLAATINEPGEDDPAKFDLDRHTILITTEFGRTPYREGDSGLDHWPGGYVQVAIGGWVNEDRAGVVGAAGEDGYSTDYITPAEFRAATLLSMGIWPFSPEAFAVGDVREGDTELESAIWLREHVLGFRT